MLDNVQDTFLTTGDPQDLDPDTVRAKVLEFENRKKEQATGSATFSFSTTTKSSKGKKATTSSSSTLAAASDKSNVECFYCKKKGHMAKVCRTKKRDKAKEKQAEKKNKKSGPGPAKCHDFHRFSPLFFLSPKCPLIQLRSTMTCFHIPYLILSHVPFLLSYLSSSFGHFG